MALKIERADNFFDRLVGLIGRDHLESGRGLMIVPCNSVHMLFMRFSIDVVFIDKNFRIKKIALNLKPWFGFAFCFGAWAVIEMNVGDVDRLGLSVGQTLNVELI